MTLALKLGAAATAFVLLLAFAEWAAREWRLSSEAGRKLAHIVGGVMAACLPAILPFPAIVSLAGAFVPFMVITRRLNVFPLIHAAERSTYGEVYFPLGVMGAALLVPHAVEFAFGVLVMAIADASASLFGQRFGKRSYRLSSADKTFVGSSVFLVATMVLGIMATQDLGELTSSSLWPVLGVALIATAEEAVASGGVDNIILPISAAVMLRLVL